MHFRSHSLAPWRSAKLGLAALAFLGFSLTAGSAEAKQYKGAEIYSQQLYKYGKIEVRMRAARGSGILSTFFTYKPGSEMAGQSWEEIDVEIFGKDNAKAFQSNILVGNPRMGSEQEHPADVSLADGYHTYTIEWTPTTVVWFRDGVEARRTTGGQVNSILSEHNFRFNLWASDAAGWAGAFDSSALPQAQYVNWIKYYRYENGAFVLDWTDDFNTFDTARWAKADWTFDGNLVDFEPNNVVVKDGTLVLCLTTEGNVGCSGAVPVDSGGGNGPGGMGGAGGMSGMGGGAGTASSGAGGMGGGAPAGGAGAGGAAGSGGEPSGSAGTGSAEAGTGGAAAGVAGAGATSSTAGAPAGTAGTSSGLPTGGSSTQAPGGTTTPGGEAADSGCGCRVASGGNTTWLWLALGLGLVARQRRRSR